MNTCMNSRSLNKMVLNFMYFEISIVFYLMNVIPDDLIFQNIVVLTSNSEPFIVGMR